MQSQSLYNQSDIILERFTKLHSELIDLSLDRVYSLLKALNNPEKKLPPVIHIAGTNGKGSTLAYIQKIMLASGYNVSRYTSPHLKQFHERICYNDVPITEKTLCHMLEKCEKANKKQPYHTF